MQGAFGVLADARCGRWRRRASKVPQEPICNICCQTKDEGPQHSVHFKFLNQSHSIGVPILTRSLQHEPKSSKGENQTNRPKMGSAAPLDPRSGSDQAA